MNKKCTVGHIFSVIGKILGTFLLILFLTVLFFCCIFAIYVKKDLSQETDFSVDSLTLNQTSVIYYYNEDTDSYEELQKLYGSENRIWASFEEIPTDLIYSCVAIEDKRFFEHKGVDWVTTTRACIKMFLGTGSAGGSTITQQLIKNLTGDNEVTVRRKLVEIYRALEFEKKHSKEEILEWYLNTIYLGEGCYGVKSAAEVYFGKDLSDLTLAECASLISITNNPSIFDPYINEEKNISRQRIVLGEMYEQGIIDKSEYEQALSQELVFQNTSGDSDEDGENESYYSYFVDEVVRNVVSDLMDETGFDYNVCYQMVLSGGYKIYATIDMDVQKAVDEIYTDLSNIPDTESYQQLQSGIVIIDNTTGDVVALSGGVGEKTGSLTYSRATQSLLSPGSCIKPLSVYAPALEIGLITPITVYDDTPYSFTDTASWPKNSDATYRGLMTVTEALERSTNTVAVKLCDDVGLEYCYRFAKEQMGLSTLVEEYEVAGSTYTDITLASMALGGLTRGVTVKAMAAAYEAIANQGVYREARTYTKVLDADDNVVLDNTQETHTAISEKTAWYLTDMMQSVVENGTGSAAALDGISVAGKTGTTTSDYDRWFCGYTPYYCAAVWCGYDDPEEVVLTDTTTNPAIQLWHSVMESIHTDKKSKVFSQPSNVVECTYCCDSGELLSTWCEKDPRGSRAATAKLYMEDIPTATCSCHVAAEICNESGHLANDYCAGVENNSTYTIGLINVERYFPISGIVVQDQEYNICTSAPDGFYCAVGLTGDPINLECYLHNENSVKSEEEEEEEENDSFDIREFIENYYAHTAEEIREDDDAADENDTGQDASENTNEEESGNSFIQNIIDWFH